jgi:hypothetical protein
MASSHDNIHASMAGLLDRMEQRMRRHSGLSGFGRTALTIVLDHLRQEVVKLQPDEQRVHDALQTWTSVMGEDFLAKRLRQEIAKLKVQTGRDQ